jgi:hypothetical protein
MSGSSPAQTRTMLYWLGLVLFLIAIAGCAPASEPIQVTPIVATSAPAPVTPGEETPGPEPLPPLVEERTVEMEWPETLRLGDSDVVRLSIQPSDEGYIVQAEFPDHQTQQREVAVEHSAGYDLYAVARLEGVAFDITPSGEQAQLLRPGDAAAWYWSLNARQPGRHRLALTLSLRWLTSSTGSIARETQIFGLGLNIQVTSFLGMTAEQVRRIGFGVLGFVAFVIGWNVMRRRRQSGKSVHLARHDGKAVIETSPGLQLTGEHARLLKVLFASYARLMIHKEFLSGYSGARTFLIQPIRPDGRSDAFTIAKVGGQRMIEREYNNYEHFVKDTLPPVTARLQHAPVSVRGSTLAAIRYTFLGDAGQVPQSLRQVLLTDPDSAHLWRLFNTFGPNWWRQNRPHAFRLAQEYDQLLPAHLILKPAASKGVRWRINQFLDERLRPAELPALQPGDRLPLRKFTRAELRADGKSMTLYGVDHPGYPPLRITWFSPEKPSIGAMAEVVADRWIVLREATKDFDRCDLPDPLLFLPAALDVPLNSTQSIIHGDLNLENILVGPGGLLWLIDFANTREGHTLADFAHLEAELIAHVLVHQVTGPEEFVQRLSANDFPLLNTLHEIASQCMHNPADPREYDLAAYLSCLGGLKYVNLDKGAKHLLYLAAASYSRKLTT